MTRSSVRFLHRGEVVSLSDVAANETLLDYLRLRRHAFGSKEGCAEGDCGACTVALGTLRGGRLEYAPVNSCICLLGMIDGKELVAVEDLASPDGALHPVQDAVLRHHGSQCGFCTPGIVMSLFTLYHGGGRCDRQAVNDTLAGNLCRCTGYRPIVDGALEACAGTPRDAFAARRAATVERLAALDDGEDLFIGDEARGFFAAPATVDALARLYAQHPDATLIAGATDVGLWITKQMRALPKIVHLGRPAGLADMRETEAGFHIGAGVTYARAESAMAAIDPDLVELFRRLGAKQVRAVGTLGGNIANGSPIGDTPPALIALGTTLHLRRGQATRSMPLEDFFIDYGKQDLAAGEFVTGIDVPRLKSDEVFPLLQNLQALRSGHLRPSGRLQVHLGGTLRRRCACRLRWHGSHAETSRRLGSRPQGPAACGPARLGRRLRGPGVGFPAHRRHAGQRTVPAGDGAGAPAQGTARGGRRGKCCDPALGPAAQGDGACRLTFLNRTGPRPLTATARLGGPWPMTAPSGTSKARRASSTTFPSRRRWCMSRPAMPRIPPAAGSPRSTSMRYGPRQASWRF